MNAPQGGDRRRDYQTVRNELPTRVHRIAGAALLVGVLLLLAGVGVDSEYLRRASLFTFAGAVCLLAAADVFYMLHTGQGIGRLSGHVHRLVNPKSFYLHIVIRLVLFVLFGVALALAVALRA